MYEVVEDIIIKLGDKYYTNVKTEEDDCSNCDLQGLFACSTREHTPCWCLTNGMRGFKEVKE